MTYAVHEDITAAATLPGRFYCDAAAFEAMRERVFGRTWQWLGDLADVAAPQSLSPRDLLPSFLDVPLLLSRDEAGMLRCLSNVCTHRGNILVKAPCAAKQIRCGYHSRRFDLAGRMTFMPEFAAAKDFPSESDHLPQVAFGQWAGLAFASLAPAAPLDAFIGDAREATAALRLEGLRPDASRSRDYEVRAHWALYVENFLEGFHIPFVHAGLNEVVDYGAYDTRVHRYSNVQLAQAKDGTPAAQYWWVFPNLMLNFYPWGLSLNLVQPLAIDRTRVLFRSFVRDAAQLETGAGASLDRVEAEDEAIVEAVQRGVRSPLYGRGRYSPTRERGVHHFHRLLVEFLG
ncbi:MAG: Rieske 2Fe-2S domain-containing protein [Burkholderiales bacterium]|nr:Rieske 2Fe-2S domain-containing protein [Burkholderiales bacterium]